VSELVNVPVPVPSVVLLELIVGFEVVAQQTPLAVTGASPFAVTFPPEEAVVTVIAEGAVVVTVGGKMGVENTRSLP